MSKYISFGKYNKLYNNIIIYIIISFIYYFVFTSELKINLLSLPKDIIVSDFLKYLGILFFSLIFYVYAKYKNNYIKNKRTLSEISSLTSDSRTESSGKINLIYNDYGKKIAFPTIEFLLIVILLVLLFKLLDFYYYIDLKGWDYWMFEMIFFSYFYSKFFKTKIYLHQKVVMIFIAFICSLLIFISDIILINQKKEVIYKDNILIIPIAIVSFLIISFLKCYSLCKLKWFMEIKFISPLKFLIWFGFIGSIISLIGSIISSNIKCENSNTSININYICKFNKTINDTYNISYYDSFPIYFNALWKGDALKIIINSIFLLIKIFLFFIINYYQVLIIQKLEPIFYLFCESFKFIIYEILLFIYLLIDKDFNASGLLIFLAEVFNFLGTLIYLELIELNFCGLNYNLRKNILKRSSDDSKIEFDNNNNVENVEED